MLDALISFGVGLAIIAAAGLLLWLGALLFLLFPWSAYVPLGVVVCILVTALGDHLRY